MSETKAYFGGGCFWCTEAVFQRLSGVSKVVSGYTAGNIKNPTYKEVSSGLTGHNEVIEITYDDEIVSFKDLLHVFFYTHDPTTLNRQGNDVGTQYRSGIYYINDIQKEEAESFKKNEAQELWSNNIVTEIEPLDVFYDGEAYHQNYFNENGGQGYCRIVIAPKVKKFQEKFQALISNG